MTKAGLRNSDGWMLRPNKTSQRRAPLISGPKIRRRRDHDHADGKHDAATAGGSAGD